jgi:hypothetical protein
MRSRTVVCCNPNILKAYLRDSRLNGRVFFASV